VVTHQLQVERRTEKVRRPKTKFYHWAMQPTSDYPAASSYLDWPSDSRDKAHSILCTDSLRPVHICCTIQYNTVNKDEPDEDNARMVPQQEAAAVGSCQRLDVSVTSTDQWRAASPGYNKCQHRLITNWLLIISSHCTQTRNLANRYVLAHQVVGSKYFSVRATAHGILLNNYDDLYTGISSGPNAR